MERERAEEGGALVVALAHSFEDRIVAKQQSPLLELVEREREAQDGRDARQLGELST